MSTTTCKFGQNLLHPVVLHDAVLDPALPGTGTLLLNNYWADEQHKVPGIKCSHTCNIQEERINQIRPELFVI